MIIFIHGRDTFRAKEFINHNITQIQTEKNPVAIKSVDANNIDLNQIKNLLQPWQLFSEKSIIILKNPLTNRPEISDFLVQYLNQPDESIFLIIWEQNQIDKRKSFFKALKKNKITQHEFSPPKSFQLNQWLKEYCHQNQINITPEASQYLTNTHHNTFQLHQEITKLKIFSDNNIAIDDIKKISPPSINSVVFELTDQIGQKNIQAIETAKQLIYQGEYPLRLLATLATHIANLLIIKESTEKGLGPKQIKEQTKLHPFVIDKGLRQCRNFSYRQLKNIYHQIAIADQEFKSGRIDFDRFIFAIINPQSNSNNNSVNNLTNNRQSTK